MGIFPISAVMLDAMVLSVTEHEDSYGYKITKDIQKYVSITETALYPVLRRQEKNGQLKVYEKSYMGRNRRYYHLTASGKEMLEIYRMEWKSFSKQIDSLLINDSEEGDGSNDN